MKPRRQRSVVIARQRINAGLDIRHVLLEERKHVGIDAPLIRHRHARLCGWARALAGAACFRREPPEHDVMAGIPGQPRQLVVARLA